MILPAGKIGPHGHLDIPASYVIRPEMGLMWDVGYYKLKPSLAASGRETGLEQTNRGMRRTIALMA